MALGYLVGGHGAQGLVDLATIQGTETLVPCLVNFISQAKVFEEYGSRTEKIMICRFQQEQKPFKSAIYEGSKYEPLDAIDAPIKGAVRLKKAGG